MIKKYQQFIGESQSEIDLIHQRCHLYKIRDYTINDNRSIDVEGDVILNDLGLTELPLKFGKVGGSFDCSDNKLKSLNGCPYLVHSDFNCIKNKLTSLVGGPLKVLDSYRCSGNKIWTFNGIGYIKYYLSAFGNPIQSVYEIFDHQFIAIDIINLKYPDFFQTDGIRYDISTDVLEEVGEDLKIEIPSNYKNLLEKSGYQLI